MDSILPNSQAFQGLRSTVFPFGDPQSRSKIADYLLPAWGQGLAAAVASRGGKTGTDLFDNLQQLASTETNDSIRATTLNAVLTNIASNRQGIPLTPEESSFIGLFLQQDEVEVSDLLDVLKDTKVVYSQKMRIKEEIIASLNNKLYLLTGSKDFEIVSKKSKADKRMKVYRLKQKD